MSCQQLRFVVTHRATSVDHNQNVYSVCRVRLIERVNPDFADRLWLHRLGSVADNDSLGDCDVNFVMTFDGVVRRTGCGESHQQR